MKRPVRPSCLAPRGRGGSECLGSDQSWGRCRWSPGPSEERLGALLQNTGQGIDVVTARRSRRLRSAYSSTPATNTKKRGLRSARLNSTSTLAGIEATGAGRD